MIDPHNGQTGSTWTNDSGRKTSSRNPEVMAEMHQRIPALGTRPGQHLATYEDPLRSVIHDIAAKHVQSLAAGVNVARNFRHRKRHDRAGVAADRPPEMKHGENGIRMQRAILRRDNGNWRIRGNMRLDPIGEWVRKYPAIILRLITLHITLSGDPHDSGPWLIHKDEKARCGQQRPDQMRSTRQAARNISSGRPLIASVASIAISGK